MIDASQLLRDLPSRLYIQWQATDKLSLAAVAAMFVAMCSTALNYSRFTPTWDELYFLHRAVCVDSAIGSLSFQDLDGCLRAMTKSPLMAFLLTPLSWLGSGVDRLNAAPFVLSLITFAQMWLLAFLVQRLRISMAIALLAALCVFLNPHAYAARGAFVADVFFAFTVANALLLLPLELEASDNSREADIRRGLLWGILGSAGVLSKFTFGYFVFFLFTPVLAISLLRVGVSRTGRRVVAALAISALPGLLFFRYGDQYLAHALNASFGEAAKFYADGRSAIAYITSSLGSLSWTIPALLVLIVAVGRSLAVERSRLIAAAYLIVLVLAFYLLSALSQNRDPRFFIPVWIALPWCIAVAAQPMESRRSNCFLPVALAVSLSVILALPNLRKFDVSQIEIARQIVGRLEGEPRSTVLLISDSPTFNIETVLVARELARRNARQLAFDTLVYDIVHGRDIEFSLDRLRRADFAIERQPRAKSAPEWANRFYTRFRETVQTNGDLVLSVGDAPPVELFRMRRN